MEGKEAIIKKIIEDAELKAKTLIDNAESVVKARQTEAQAWADEYKSVQENIAVKEASETVARRITVADLDVRKLLLGAKQEVIGEVFEKVYEKLLALPKAQYLAFVEKLINATAEDGDEVVMSKDNVLAEEDIKSLKVYKEKNLKISTEKGDFMGGVKLIGVKCDKDLTFKAYTDSLVNEYALKIAEEIF